MKEAGSALSQWSGWVATGLAGTSLAWMTWHVVRAGIDWANAVLLVLTIVVAALITAMSPLSLSELLVSIPPPAEVWRWAPVVSPMRVGLAVAAAIAIGWAMLVERAAGPGQVGWDVGGPWLAGVGLMGLCAWWPNRVWPGWMHRDAWTGREGLWWVVVAGLAFGTRLCWPSRFPSIVDGDEGAFLQMAREARSGDMANPFATGWLEVPNLYPAVMGWLSHLTGDGLDSYRLVMAVIGSVTVLATWRLGRVVVGADAALVGAVVLAVMPIHLMFTRTALFHGTDPAALMLGLLFLHRAVASNRAGDAWLAGVMVGCGWYGYWGARSLPLTMALLLLLTARPLWRVATPGLWAASGFLATIAPLVVTFIRYPPAFAGRVDVTSVTTTPEWQRDPVGAVESRLRDAAFMPLMGNHAVFYQHDPPVIGWPVAWLLVLGVSGLLAAVLRTRRWQTAAWLVVPSVVLVGVLGQVDKVELHRFLLVVPIWTLVIGVGIVVLGRWLAALPIGRWSRLPIAPAVVTGALMLLAISSLGWVFSTDRIGATWGDQRTVAAWDLGWRLDEGDPPVILLAGPPYVFANSNPAFRFEAPSVTMTEIAEPMTRVEDVPPLTPETLLVLVPERVSEQCVVREAWPEAIGFEVRTAGGVLLYVVYGEPPLRRWALATSPAGTVVEMVEQGACGSDQQLDNRVSGYSQAMIDFESGMLNDAW